MYIGAMSGQGSIVQSLSRLDHELLLKMHQAGEEIRECNRVLHKADANIVSEVLREQGTFYEWDHYPKGDVFDFETHSQYYYHAHRPEEGEHGHFHLFLRGEGFPPGSKQVEYSGEADWPKGEDRIAHLIAISMDSQGFPIRLFTTNRWVTGENFFAAADVVRMLDSFVMDHAWPSWPANRWLSAMLVLFRPQIEKLIYQRDEIIKAWTADHPAEDVYEDRNLEVTSMMTIDPEAQIIAVEKALGVNRKEPGNG